VGEEKEVKGYNTSKGVFLAKTGEGGGGNVILVVVSVERREGVAGRASAGRHLPPTRLKKQSRK